MAVVLDIIDGAGLKEVAGRIEEITRIARVEGITSSTNSGILSEALSASGLPAHASQHPDVSTLFVQERSVGPGGPTHDAEVSLVYKRFDIGFGESPEPAIAIDGGTFLERKETQFDAGGSQITLVYPVPNAGNPGVTQSGSIRPLIPKTVIAFEVVEQIQYPGTLSQQWAGYLNNASWSGGAPRTWICTAARFRGFDLTASPPRWLFRYEFAYDEDGWDETAVFIDPESGLPPSDLTEGFGFKTINYNPARGFGSKFAG